MLRASFIIPAYNAQKYLSKAIFSCRNQTIKQVEIIVINDGSTDDTQGIIDWHAKEDPRVVPIRLLQNCGRSYARNAGNDAAQADFLFVLDSDDMAARNRVKDSLACFQLKKADLLYGSFFLTDSRGIADKRIVASAFSPEESKEERQNFICHSTMAYRKELAEKIRYDEGAFSNLGLDDWKFQWDAYRSGCVIRHVKSPLAYYRWTEDGVSATRNQEDVDKVKAEFLASL